MGGFLTSSAKGQGKDGGGLVLCAQREHASSPAHLWNRLFPLYMITSTASGQIHGPALRNFDGNLC